MSPPPINSNRTRRHGRPHSSGPRDPHADSGDGRHTAGKSDYLREWGVRRAQRIRAGGVARPGTALHERRGHGSRSDPQLHRGQGGAFTLPLTQEVIADATGLSVVHVNRILQRLLKEGLLDLALAGR